MDRLPTEQHPLLPEAVGELSKCRCHAKRFTSVILVYLPTTFKYTKLALLRSGEPKYKPATQHKPPSFSTQTATQGAVNCTRGPMAIPNKHNRPSPSFPLDLVWPHDSVECKGSTSPGSIIKEEEVLYLMLFSFFMLECGCDDWSLSSHIGP